jgi:hypothetical protein
MRRRECINSFPRRKKFKEKGSRAAKPRGMAQMLEFG